MNHITQEQALAMALKFGDWTGQTVEMNDVGLQSLCNAAIEWYIAQQAASVDATFKKWNAVQDRNAAVLDLYKNSPEMNTSQERVQKTAKSEQMPLTDEQIEDIGIEHIGSCFASEIGFARAIEAAHGIKEPKV